MRSGRIGVTVQDQETSVEDEGDAIVDDVVAPRSRTRARAILVARIAASVGMLGLLVAKLGSSEKPTMPEWTRETFLWLFGAAVLTLAGIVLSALRWQSVLNVFGQHTHLRRLLSHYMAGQFVANVLPTTIGGDVLRVTRQTKDSGNSPSSFASVVLERMTGWLVLPVITFAGLVLNPGLRDLGRATQVAVSLAAGTLVLLIVVLVLVAQHHYSDIEHEHGWRRFIAAVSLGIHEMRRQPRQAASVILVGFAYQLALVGAAVMAAQALGIPAAGPTALLAFFPAVAIAQVLPISISGIGVREGLFVLFLHPLGVPTEQAVALGLLLYLLNLGVSLLGAPAFAVGGRGGPNPAT